MVCGLGENESTQASSLTKTSWPTGSGSDAGGATSGGPSAPVRKMGSREDGGGVTPVQMTTASRGDEMMKDIMAQLEAQQAQLAALMELGTPRGSDLT